jgi:hypothetical protein
MKEQNELIAEGRASIVNGIVAYGEAFGLLRQDEITEALFEDLSLYVESIESLMPVLISMYEMTKKLSGNPDLSFMEWLEEVARKSGGKEFGLF